MIDEQTIQRLHERVDEHGRRLTVVETLTQEQARRLEALENMPRDLNHVRSQVDRLSGQMTVITWLLFAIAGGVIAAGFALFRGAG